MFGSQEKQRRPRLCPACGTLVGSTANRCHQCGASLTFSMAAMSRSLSKYMPANAPVTYLVLFACCILYGISLLFTIHSGASMAPQGSGILDTLLGLGNVSSGVLQRLGASMPFPIDRAQPWRFVTACFLHANLMHIGFNMWVLIDLGPVLEELYGSARFLFIYVATGIGGYVLSGFLGHFSIGASGALVGLIGVLLAITFRRGGAGMQQLRSYVYRWIIYLILWGFFFPGIDNMAHLGGGITGLILGRLMLDREPQTPIERKRAYTLGWSTAAVVLISFALMIFWSNHVFFF
ncbi:MAG TPA: rhomboid family intramembrane serine protease [Candidatus Acidoferrales bacterium]|nr:rhomboid family intramembrane serine protease [Candidatus Acidoferrales bacterium]